MSTGPIGATPVKAPLTQEDIRRAVADLTGHAPDAVGDADDLIALGVASIDVMKLAAIWCSRGVRVSFGELLERRTIGEWWSLVADRLPAVPAMAPSDAASEANAQAMASSADNLVESASAGANASAHASAPIAEDGEPFDLATMQYAYWFGRGHGPGAGAASHFYFEFDGEGVDADRLEAAVHRLYARHPMLRAQFLDSGQQRILPDAAWPGLTRHDLRALDDAARAERLEQLRTTESSRQLDVANGVGFDVHLSLLPAGRTRLHVNIDMLVSDAASFRILISELAAVYADPQAALPAIGYTFRRYLADKQHAPIDTRHRDYWAARLGSLPAPPALPYAGDPARLERPRTVRREFRMDRVEWDRLAAAAREHGLTLAMTFVTAFAEVMAAWSRSPAFLINVPLFDRRPLHRDVDLVVGDFTGSLLLEADLSGDESFAGHARRLQAQLRSDVAHAAYPGVSVLRDLWRLSPETPPLAPVVFTSSLDMGELFTPLVFRQFGRLAWMISQTPQVWLDNQVVEIDGELLVNWDAVDGIFAPGVLDAMFDAYRTLIGTLGRSHAAWIGRLPDLRPAAQIATRAAVNATEGPPPGQTLHAGFFARAAREPERPAMLWGETGEASYGAIAGQALRIGAWLASQGVAAGDAVIVSLAKGPEQAAAVLGVLAAGGVYVPLSPEQPSARRERILANAQARVVIDAATIAAASAMPPLAACVETPPEALAYIIYTSGSTGEPKGVEVSHAAAQNTIEALNARYAIGPDDRCLAISALDFDLSVYDLFGLLQAGGAVVMPAEAERRDAAACARLVARWGVTVWNSVPVLLDMLLTAAADGELRSLRVVLLGGDWVGADLPARLAAQAPRCRFAGLGGTTETAIHSTVCEVARADADWRSIPYGVPLRNVQCRVVDTRGRDCPDQVAGELWIGGTSVADGYRGRPDLTAQRFVAIDGVRWYRTGDLGRYWPDGTLEFLGRTDFQVKIRGHRIELGEIEAALAAAPGVLGAVAVAFGANRQRLGAAIVRGDAALDEASLRERVAAQVPAYMVPERILLLEHWPLSANGKLDRGAIARVIEAGAGAAEPAPDGADDLQGAIEPRVAALWVELLDAARVGRQDNFFALGGDSLLATRLLARLRDDGLAGGGLRALFERPTLAAFAATLREGGEALSAAAIVPDLASAHEPFPMTPIQRAYWMGRRGDVALGGVGSYWYWEFDGRDVDLARLEQAWNRLIARHGMLRVIFADDGTQRVLAEVPPFRIDVREAAPGTEAEALRALRAAAASRAPFDLTAWPLYEIRALRYGDGACRIGFGFDYAALDALSIITIFAELERLYLDPDAALPSVDLSFRDYVIASERWAGGTEASRAYWQARAATLPPPPAPPEQAGTRGLARFTRREHRVDAAIWQRLKARAREHGLTPSALLAAAYGEVLSAWSGGAAVTLNLTLFDRQPRHPHITRVVGDFTSLMLLPFEPQAGEPWTQTVERLQGEMWNGLEHGSVSALWVMREIAARRGAAAALMPFVFTSTLGVADDKTSLSFPFGRYAGGVSQTPQVWLDNQVVEHDGGLLVNWDAVEGPFAPGVLDAMFGAYRTLLDWLGAPDRAWSEPLPDLRPAAQAAVRAAVNDTAQPRPPGTLAGALHGGFFDRAAREPARPAVLWGESGQWTYGEVAQQALRVGAWLRAQGVAPGDAVAVSLPKGPAQAVAVLGVLAAGGVYVPVSPEQPAARREKILANAAVRVVLDATSMAAAASTPPLAAPVEVSPASLAYVIYTSGSTGEPKGVEMTHAAAQNTIVPLNARYAIGAEDRSLAISALDFDLSVYDLFGLLQAGGAVVMPDETERRDAAAWARLVARWRVTVWNSVPVLLDMLLTAAEDGQLHSLRVAFASGDWVGLDLPARTRTLAPDARFVAMGGATEAAIWSNAIDVTDVQPEWRSIPYGYPLPNQRYRVVDARGRDCPDWVAGELWIGGDGVAAGYRGQPEATASRFLAIDGVRWYRTGDLGRYWPDGTLEFLGRTDFQVKIRGHRIELGEIEAALAAAPGVLGAVAVAFGVNRQRLGAAVILTEPLVEPVARPSSAGSDGRDATGAADVADASDTSAAADVVEDADDAAGDALRRHVASRLPAYMVPERILRLEAWPLSANGKLDRGAIARLVEADGLQAAPHADADAEPMSDVERQLALLWRDLLGRDRIARGDNFFMLGGDSLLATRLVQQARQRFGLDLPLQELFAAPALADLAALVCTRMDSTETGVIE